MLTSNILVLVGLGFTLLPLLLIVPLFLANPWAVLFPLFFLVGGLSMINLGWKSGRKTLHAFRDGIAVQGNVHSINRDHTTTVNGQHPWKLTYHFPVDNRIQSGTITTFNSIVGTFKYGQPLWVLYLPEDHEASTVYPPIK
ncbi:hypothetical protein FEM03_15970 [Phragmitibacter flavus]|uniref:DUF3592 domain-containing protein n=1 Tax=Phragmitibacter flavus TaxID=2576071 RepID=A0A5R8KE02_9BACT|nr:hypothetical protein [Phragmitibacter flavus]TLD69819.1 hypothetical protein FEM03_15970 [Phragmitibacter flavus]